MKRSVSLTWGSVKVGVLIIFAVVVLFWASYTGGGTSIFTPKDQLVCYFKNINGLVPGAPIWMAGVEVGNVSNVKFVNLDPERKVEVRCKVREDVWYMITEGSTVHLGSIGFLGDRYVEIDPGPLDAPRLTHMDTIPTEPVSDAGAMFESGERAFENVGTVVDDLNLFLSRMNKGEGTLGKIATDEVLYARMTELLASLTKLSADLQKNQERLVTSIEKTSNSIATLSDQVESNTGTLGKIANDPALYDNLAASSARLDTVMSFIQNAEGTMGLMVRDTALYTELVDLLARANNMIDDIQANPRKYFKFSVF